MLLPSPTNGCVMKQKDLRIEALKRFAAAITALNIAGHFFLGFEQSVAHALVALLTAYTLEISFEFIQAHSENRKTKFSGGVKNLVLFLLPGHISALAVSMLLFTNEGLMPVVLATAIAILSKIIIRVKMKGVYRHFLNPSNAGISITLLLFPWVGIAQPYQFTENVNGAGDFILPVIFIVLGSFLNTKFTKKMPLIFAWAGGFALQAVIRSLFLNASLISALSPMTGVAFLLYSFYMISDPATTPVKKSNQVIFGLAVAMTYGILVSLHVVFGLFFSLIIICCIRGAYFFILQLSSKTVKQEEMKLVESYVLEK